MDQICKQFEDYLHSYQVVKNKVQFTFFPYDLIDKDLDIDEFAYEKTQSDFRNELEKWIVKNGEMFVVEEKFLEFRDVLKTASRCTQYTPVAGGKMMRTVTELLD